MALPRFVQKLIRDADRDHSLVEQLGDRLATLVYEVYIGEMAFGFKSVTRGFTEKDGGLLYGARFGEFVVVTLRFEPVGSKNWRVLQGRISQSFGMRTVFFSEDLAAVQINGPRGPMYSGTSVSHRHRLSEGEIDPNSFSFKEEVTYRAPW